MPAPQSPLATRAAPPPPASALGPGAVRHLLLRRLRAEVLPTVVAGRLLPPGAVVAVGLGRQGLHGAGARAARAGPRLGILAAPRGGGRGHRRPRTALAAVRRQAVRWDLPLTVGDLRGPLRGWTMGRAVARLAPGSAQRALLHLLTRVLRRRALEEGRLVGATHVVTPGERRRGPEGRGGRAHARDGSTVRALGACPSGNGGLVCLNWRI